jgi:hypothetical protein
MLDADGGELERSGASERGRTKRTARLPTVAPATPNQMNKRKGSQANCQVILDGPSNSS